jgi:ABC-type multidrug transport system permease subunit
MTALERAHWAAADTWTLTLRAFAHWARQPGVVAVGLLFPVLMVLIFSYLLGGGMSVPGGGDYREFLIPGALAMTMVFGVENTMVTVTADALKGVTDRFRSMPMSSAAVVLGRCVADMLFSAAGLAVMVACGLAIGWSWHGSAGDAVAALALLLWLRFAALWVGVYLGLIVKTPEGTAAVQTLIFPFVFLSNAFAAPETMPDWLGTIAAWNPLSSTVAAARELFGNPGWGGDSWIATHAVLMAVLWPLAISAIFLPLAVRRWRGLGR